MSYPDVIRPPRDFVPKSIAFHERRLFLASDQGHAAWQHYKDPNNYSYAGLRYRDIRVLTDRGHGLYLDVKWSWYNIAIEMFLEWPTQMGRWLSFGAGFMKHAKVSDADEMFLLGNFTETIPVREFPETLPLGIKNIIEIYRIYLADNDRLGKPCPFLAQCKKTTDQPLHPACRLGQSSDRTPQELAAYLKAWAPTWRHRDTTLPRSEESTVLFDLPANLAQMKDVIDQLLQSAEKIATLEAQRQTTYERIKWWWGGTPNPIKDYHTIVAAA
uniref:WGS project CBMG000000000 data, contig CS5907-c001056 n=1 Tax=Fusarium acuminatum CS5907 TaxID=1318461 RepID=A0A096PFJ7_9HYPO|nr:unnamed protein product [Fusarium acuminatum CS5907]